MAAIGIDRVAAERVPDLHGTIIATRSDMPAIGRPGYDMYPAPVATKDDHAVAIGGIPNTHRLIVAGRCYMGTSWRPCDGQHTAGMAGADKARIALRPWQRCSFGRLWRSGNLRLLRRLVARWYVGGQWMRSAHQVLCGNALQFLLDDGDVVGPLIDIDLQHMHDECFKPSQYRMIPQLQGSEVKWAIGRIIAGQHLVESGSQGVDVSAWRGLRPAILFGGGVAGGSERGCIFGLPWFEVPGNAEIDQVDMPMWGEHDVCGFEIAEDDGWLPHMQIFKHGAKLDTDLQHFFDRELFPIHLMEMLLHRFTFDEVHHQVPASHVGELFVDTWEIGVRQAGQQHGLAIESGSSLGKLLGAEIILAHLLNGDEPVAELEIGGFIDGPKTTLADLLQDTIALLEQMVGDEQSSTRRGMLAALPAQELPASKAKRCLRTIGRPAGITEKWRRENHLCRSLVMLSGKI